MSEYVPEVKRAKADAFAAGTEAMGDAARRLCLIMAEQLEVEHSADVPPYTPDEVAQLFRRFGDKTLPETQSRVMTNNPFELVPLTEKDIERLRNGLPRVLRTPAAEPLASTRKPRASSRGERKRSPNSPEPSISGSDA